MIRAGVGTLVILLIMNLTFVVMGARQMYQVMAMDEVKNIYLSGAALAPVHPRPMWLISSLHLISNVLMYCSWFLAPLCLIWRLNRDEIQRLLPHPMHNQP